MLYQVFFFFIFLDINIAHRVADVGMVCGNSLGIPLGKSEGTKDPS